MKKIIIFITFCLLLISCTQKENNIWSDIKNWNILPKCSTLPEWTNQQCEIDESYIWETEKNTWNIKENNLNNNPDKEMTDNYQTALPKSWDIVAIMKTTNGTIKIKLFTEDVPSVTNNFIWLANEGYYDGIIFHRVINNFMIQWWDPDGTWMWGTSIYWEKFNDEFSDKLTNMIGSISMANAWADTNWSQFFINQRDNSNLDFNKEPLTSKHAVFGQVYEGIDNVNKIAKTKVGANDRPVKEVKIISLEIFKLEWSKQVEYKINKEEIVKKYNEKNTQLKESKKTKEIEAWDKISVNYTWKLEDWTVFDSSLNPWRAPLEFTVWAGQMIKWFDAWVVWMKIWDKKNLTLKPSEAYWEYNEKNVQEIPKEQLKSFEDAGIKLEVWVELPTQMGKLKIKEIKWDIIIIDANHELAWKTLTFEVEIIEIK